MTSPPPSNSPSHRDSAGAPEPTAAPPPPTLSLPVSEIVADSPLTIEHSALIFEIEYLEKQYECLVALGNISFTNPSHPVAAVTVQDVDNGDDPAEISALEKARAELDVGIAKARDGADEEEDGEVLALRKEVGEVTAVVETDVPGEEDKEIAVLEKDLAELEASFRTTEEEKKTAQEKKKSLHLTMEVLITEKREIDFKIIEVQTEAQTKREQYQRLNESHKSSLNKIDQLMSQIKTAEEKNSKLRGKINALRGGTWPEEDNARDGEDGHIVLGETTIDGEDLEVAVEGRMSGLVAGGYEPDQVNIAAETGFRDQQDAIDSVQNGSTFENHEDMTLEEAERHSFLEIKHESITSDIPEDASSKPSQGVMILIDKTVQEETTPAEASEEEDVAMEDAPEEEDSIPEYKLQYIILSSSESGSSEPEHEEPVAKGNRVYISLSPTPEPTFSVSEQEDITFEDAHQDASIPIQTQGNPVDGGMNDERPLTTLEYSQSEPSRQTHSPTYGPVPTCDRNITLSLERINGPDEGQFSFLQEQVQVQVPQDTDGVVNGVAQGLHDSGVSEEEVQNQVRRMKDVLERMKAGGGGSLA